MALINLHSHSRCSDGNLSPSELAAAVSKARIGYFSLTDHDISLGWTELEPRLKELGIHYLSGIELSTSLHDNLHILGYGLNFQCCAQAAFVGLGDSYEQYYQAIRRCWRFGQTRPVTAHVIISEAERVVVENVRRKEAAATDLSRSLVEHMRDFEREELAS